MFGALWFAFRAALAALVFYYFALVVAGADARGIFASAAVQAVTFVRSL